MYDNRRMTDEQRLCVRFLRSIADAMESGRIGEHIVGVLVLSTEEPPTVYVPDAAVEEARRELDRKGTIAVEGYARNDVDPH